MGGLREHHEGNAHAHLRDRFDDGLLDAPRAISQRCNTTSVSLLVWKMEPSRTVSSRSSPAFTRLPLCAMAI